MYMSGNGVIHVSHLLFVDDCVLVVMARVDDYASLQEQVLLTCC